MRRFHLTKKSNYKQMKDNTTLWIVVSVIGIHFLVGVGWLFYKIMGAKPSEKMNPEKEDIGL
jgi:hypothetical protein